MLRDLGLSTDTDFCNHDQQRIKRRKGSQFGSWLIDSVILISSMPSPFGVFVALFAAVWLFFVARGIVTGLKRGKNLNWIVGVMGLLVLVGAGGFFASALAAMDVLRFPSRFEWPAGYVNGVVATADGKYVVPLEPPGRVQLYDSQWHFIRGWHVNASGGGFKVACSPNGEIMVLVARGRHLDSFTEHGDLVSTTVVSDSFVLTSRQEQSLTVPTSPWLWVFSSPFLSWGVALLGFAGLGIINKFEPDKSDKSGENAQL